MPKKSTETQMQDKKTVIQEGDRLLTTREAAVMLGMAPSTLMRARVNHDSNHL